MVIPMVYPFSSILHVGQCRLLMLAGLVSPDEPVVSSPVPFSQQLSELSSNFASQNWATMKYPHPRSPIYPNKKLQSPSWFTPCLPSVQRYSQKLDIFNQFHGGKFTQRFTSMIFPWKNLLCYMMNSHSFQICSVALGRNLAGKSTVFLIPASYKPAFIRYVLMVSHSFRDVFPPFPMVKLGIPSHLCCFSLDFVHILGISQALPLGDTRYRARAVAGLCQGTCGLRDEKSTRKKQRLIDIET